MWTACNLFLQSFPQALHQSVQHAGEVNATGKAKIEPFINMLCDRFTEIYCPLPEISIDEMVVGFKGSWKFKQYNASKPSKYHIKSFGLCDSSNGYVLNLLTYYGSQTSYDPATDPNSVASVKIFDKLLSCVGKGYHVFADRWYVTKALVDFMLEKGHYFTGTVQSNRVGFPPQVKQGLQLGHMDSTYYATADNKILYCAWKDKKAKKPVLIVSTKTYQSETPCHRGKMSQS